ncbi:calcium uptake protein 3, mitochondrial isoform X1 [Vombatus ursinus]|uniref:calcium uptake protein 3, mitochondrial isoform X1 n=1 Tax=Vombatus ursinus TaxID=29139 RepID=UPI000FFD368F|nr:calcium uptake protein 3, mitochondrial isoform X1 [Vombatus ursinus]XP_027709455.1 calcium uptake protein 3, mitochondrial isoform X1 [Vombatus ursinus]
MPHRSGEIFPVTLQHKGHVVTVIVYAYMYVCMHISVFYIHVHVCVLTCIPPISTWCMCLQCKGALRGLCDLPSLSESEALQTDRGQLSLGGAPPRVCSRRDGWGTLAKHSIFHPLEGAAFLPSEAVTPRMGSLKISRDPSPWGDPFENHPSEVLKTGELISRSYWDTLRRNTSQALFSDLAERADDITNLVSDTTLLVHFFGKKGKAELNFEDFYRFMDNLQTEVLEIEFLSYSNGMNTISEEDFARILLRYTNVENTAVFLDNVRYNMIEEKGITFDEFRSFFQFLNNLEDFAIALNMYNFASRSIGQDEFKRAVYVATGLKLSPHLVNTIFKIFDVDKDDQLSYKEFIGIMKDRLQRGFRGYKTLQRYPTFKSCLKKELHSR